MIRPLALSFAAGVALLTATVSGADETFPVVHNEPITVRILGGNDGQPLAHLHLILIAGYDQIGLHDQLFREEALTDAHGQARLSNQLANLPWLQVWVNKEPLCQAHPRKASFSVELIRRDGLSAPNRCGIATVENAPGVFTVFVRNKTKDVPAESSMASASAQTPASDATATPAPEAQAQKPALSEAGSPTPHLSVAAVAVPLPATPASTPEEAAVKIILPAQEPTPAPETQAQKPAPAETTSPAPHLPETAVVVPLPVTPASAPAGAAVKAVLPDQTVAAPAPVVVSAGNSASVPAKAEAHSPARRVVGKPVSHRVAPVSHRARRVLASCPVQQPVAKTAPAADATHKPKPAAGVRRAAATPANPSASPKQE